MFILLRIVLLYLFIFIYFIIYRVRFLKIKNNQIIINIIFN